MPVTKWSERVLTVDTCVEALDAAAVGYTWGAEQRALESMHLKLAAHVAVLDTPGVEALKRDMSGRLKSVNRRPYSPAEDRAESYANVAAHAQSRLPRAISDADRSFGSS